MSLDTDFRQIVLEAKKQILFQFIEEKFLDI